MNKMMENGVKFAIGFATSVGVATIVKPKLDEMEPKDLSKFEKICTYMTKAGIQYAIVGVASAALFTMFNNTIALLPDPKSKK